MASDPCHSRSHLYTAIPVGQVDVTREVFCRQFPMFKLILSLGLPETIKASLQLNRFDVGASSKPLKDLTDKAIVELGHLHGLARNQ